MCLTWTLKVEHEFDYVYELNFGTWEFEFGFQCLVYFEFV